MWILPIAYLLVPGLIGAFAIGLFLTRRPITSTTLWLVGVFVVGVLVAGISWAIYRQMHGGVQAATLLEAFATLYYIPFIVLTGATLAIRTRLQSRGVGVALLIVLFLATGVVARYASGYFLDFVNASG